MNTVVTSRAEILCASRKLIQQGGWSAVHIRSVADACGVSVGSIYNYFDSKAALLAATVESIWCEVFHRPEDGTVFPDIQSCILWAYRQMEYGCSQYPGLFSLHSLGFIGEEKWDGKQRMQQTWLHIIQGLCSVLQRDPNIRPNAFTDSFPSEEFANLLFSLMLSALMRQDYNPAPVLELVRRTVYEYPAAGEEC